MKKFLFLGGMFLLPYLIQAQNIFSGEPIQWVGRPNGYSTTPYNSDYRTTGYRKVSTTTNNPSDGRGQWATTINVQSSGGNITPDNMPGGGGAGWLLISGPSGNRFQNKWNFSGIGQAGLNAINNITRQGGGEDMGLNMGTTGYYTFVMRDAGYNNSEVYIGYTASEPVTVSHLGQTFSNGQPVISISTNNTPSAGENIYVRYRVGTNDFTTGTSLVQATGLGTSWTATLPLQNCNTTVYYYVFTSTRNLSALNGDTEQNRSLATLRYDDSSGSNYSFNISQSSAAVLSGGATICSGDSSVIQVSITGGISPYTLVYSDGTSNFTVNNYESNTEINISPTSTATFSIVSVTGANGCTGIGNSGTALVTVNENITYYADNDGDGFGDIAVTQDSCVGAPEGFVLDSSDCDDSNETVYPGAPEICYDGLDNDCDGIIDNGCTPLVSVVQPTQCGVTLPAVDSSVFANLVAGAQGYRFRVTNLSTNQVQTIDRVLRVFRFTQLMNYAFDTEYAVEVSVRINNVWQPFYGTPCNVSTPDTTTQIQASQCNTTLSNTNIPVFADIVPFATGYRFRVTNTLNPIDVQTVDRPLREFRLTNLASFEYNTTYNVEVAVRNTDGMYLSYGPVCNITTPTLSTVGLVDTQCDEYLVSSNSETLFAEFFPGAEGYRFLLENVSEDYSQTVDRALRTVTLSNFTGLLPGTTYTVRVAIRLNGVWGPYGKSCSIITPGEVGRTDEVSRVDAGIAKDFKAIAYPNPFATSFAIDVRTSNTETVSLTVYDMTGRLLEVREVKAQDVTNYQFGDRYPSGVYNVIVTQGEETRTVRVVKQ
jgi:hypothetical protein